MSEGLTVSRINDIAMSKAGQSALYAATDRGIFRLPAGSSIWEEASDGLLSASPNVYEISIDPIQPERLYASVSLGIASGTWGVYRSEDGGTSWSEGSTGLFLDAPIAVLNTTPLTIIAGSFQGAFRSQDRGTNWQLHTAGLPANPIFRDFTAHPSDPTIIYASLRDLLGHGVIPYKSLDGGRTWTQSANGLPESVLWQRDSGLP
jgi:photosystem II stability/assembly factor-like uncharacterized protein